MRSFQSRNIGCRQGLLGLESLKFRSHKRSRTYFSIWCPLTRLGCNLLDVDETNLRLSRRKTMTRSTRLVAITVCSTLILHVAAACGANGSQSDEHVRSLDMKSKKDIFLKPMRQGQDWIIQAVSYKFAPRIRVYEMGVAQSNYRGITRGQLVASSLENETGRRETSACQAYYERDNRGNTIYGAEVHLAPIHNGPYIIEVNGTPMLLNSKTLNYRIAFETSSTSLQSGSSLPPITPSVTPPFNTTNPWNIPSPPPFPSNAAKSPVAKPAHADNPAAPPAPPAPPAGTASESFDFVEKIFWLYGPL
jgi:hypothetical protein